MVFALSFQVPYILFVLTLIDCPLRSILSLLSPYLQFSLIIPSRFPQKFTPPRILGTVPDSLRK